MPPLLVLDFAVSVKEAADSFISLVKNLGWAKSLTILLFFFFAYLIQYLLRSVLKAKDGEIARLVKDNEDYRTTYLKRQDEDRGVKPPSARKIPPKK